LPEAEINHMKKELYPWQKECLRLWTENGGRGIVNVVTGAGKTLIGLAAAERISETISAESPVAGLKIYIVVPKIFLASQWARALRGELDFGDGEIGYWHGSRKDARRRKCMIYVINSARGVLARHIADDLNAGRAVLLIADECHHYGTPENARIFDFIPFIPISGRYYALGLSATPYSPRFREILAPALGREIYRYGFAKALEENIINPFAVFHIALEFTPWEWADYRNFTESLSTEISKLKQRHPHLRGAGGRRFVLQLKSLRESADRETAELASSVLLLMYRRKEIVYLARARLGCVLTLLAGLGTGLKIILFSERIETAEYLYACLPERRRRMAGLYHSGMEANARRNALRRFGDGEIRILFSCKALDEGLNVPDADACVIVSSTGTERQRIQRMGRVLRKRADGKISRLYYLYVSGTTEETELLRDLSGDLNEIIPVVELSYNDELENEDGTEGRLTSPLFDECAERVRLYMDERGWDAKKTAEAVRIMETAVLSCDWLMTEAECREKINRSAGREEKNGYVVALLLARARLGVL
jgi:superfamily II DNA or RNA helicase